jgi:hypothetical protein
LLHLSSICRKQNNSINKNNSQSLLFIGKYFHRKRDICATYEYYYLMLVLCQ